MRYARRILSLILASTLALAATLAFLSLPRVTNLSETGPAQAANPGGLSTGPSLLPGATPAPTATFFQLLPAVLVDRPPHVELLQAGALEEPDFWRTAFLPDEPFSYGAAGLNNLPDTVTASLRLTRTGACSPALIFSDTLGLAPGAWLQTVPSAGLACLGVYTASAALDYETLSPTLSSQFVVNEPSTITITQRHGFDRCRPPTVEEMQAWWDGSPYWIFNLYLGGVSFFCSDTPLDSVWVHQVAQQGWTFLLAWVGPQAPCTGFTHRMSADPATAYLEGRAEAAAAAEAARQLGFLGDQVIYYDMEGYGSATSSCRQTVSAFMRGWVDALHALGLKAGGYGGACSSYVADWAGNNPPPDDVWLAHWYLSGYTDTATVWDTPCVSNSLWADQQRIKQYAGDHAENWNGVTLVIDSNVADGEVTFLPPVPPTGPVPGGQVLIQRSGTPVEEMGLFGASQGWIQTGGRLLRTAEAGEGWVEVTPQGVQVLDAEFTSSDQAWAVGMLSENRGLVMARSTDVGVSWQLMPIPAAGGLRAPPARAHLALLDESNAFLALRLPSGSAFSLGQLYFTADGGRSWEQRELPIGAAITFLDTARGWTAGGPAGDQLFATLDGGRTWRAQTLDTPPGVSFTLGQPRFDEGERGRLPVLLDGPSGRELALFQSDDAGESWRLVRDGAWTPHDLTWALPPGGVPALPAGLGLPAGSVRVEFLDETRGWALVRVGSCQGEKGGDPVTDLFCEEIWALLATADGGSTWRELSISPPAGAPDPE